MKRAITIADARTLARIVNLAERCNCAYRAISAEHHGDASYYHVLVDIEGLPEALRLFDSQLHRILSHDKEIIA